LDPFSQIVTLLKPRAVFWRVVEAHDDWTIRFLPSQIVVFGQMIAGSARVERDDGAALTLAAGDFLLMPAPPPWTIAGGGGGPAVDFKAAMDDPGQLLSARPNPAITRFIAGNFAFSPANADLVARLMLPVVHVRAGAPCRRGCAPCWQRWAMKRWPTGPAARWCWTGCSRCC